MKYETKDKLEIFTDSGDDEVFDEEIKGVALERRRLQPNEQQIRFTTTQKIIEFIKKLNIRVAPRWDRIRNRMVKEVPEEYIKGRLKKLFNKILEEQ